MNLGNDDLIDFQIKVYLSISYLSLKDYQKVQSAIFGFLKKSVYMDRKRLIPNFEVFER